MSPARSLVLASFAAPILALVSTAAGFGGVLLGGLASLPPSVPTMLAGSLAIGVTIVLVVASRSLLALLGRLVRVEDLARALGALLEEPQRVPVQDLPTEIERVLELAGERMRTDRALADDRAAALDKALGELAHDLIPTLRSLSRGILALSPGPSEIATAALADLLNLEQVSANRGLEHRLSQALFVARPEYLDLRGLVVAARAAIEPWLARRGVQFHETMPSLTVWVWADRRLIDRALTNLFHLAAKEAEQSVSVELTVNAGAFKLEVTANGSPDPAREHPRGATLQRRVTELALRTARWDLNLSDAPGAATVAGQLAGPPKASPDDSTRAPSGHDPRSS